MITITRKRVEDALNRCANAQPPVNYILGKDLRVLATIWALMNHFHRDVQDIDLLTEVESATLVRWMVPTDDEIKARACALSAAASEGCDVCQ